MKIITTNIRPIMIVSGALTCTMAYAAIAPQAALLSSFGETLNGPLSEIVVRNWGALIALIGMMLIYGAFNPAVRSFSLTIAAISKLIFIVLVLFQGARYLGEPVGIAIAIDLVWVLLFAVYLVNKRPTANLL
ncbi:MAG: cbb3-type cytochrome oxidase subunit 1 [Hyphomicrobiaceae bacterium]|jgi:cbb3-type cytochrome oxidase subunit 1